MLLTTLGIRTHRPRKSGILMDKELMYKTNYDEQNNLF